MDRFEKLAKDMAGMNRRDALRRAGGGLAGAMLAAFGLGRAKAEPIGGAPGCDEICDPIFGPNGFFPNRPFWGRCMQSCNNCPNTAGGTCSPPNFFKSCTGPFEFCVCFDTIEGGGFCGQGASCAALPTCMTSSDCPAGWTCSADTCCGFNVCNPPCGISFFGAVPIGGPAPTGPTNFSL